MTQSLFLYFFNFGLTSIVTLHESSSERLRFLKNLRNTPVPQATSSTFITHFSFPNKTECPCLKCYFQAICEKLPKKAVHGRQFAFRVHTAPNSPLRTQRIRCVLFFCYLLVWTHKARAKRSCHNIKLNKEHARSSHFASKAMGVCSH